VFQLLAFVFPRGANFEYFDALSINAERKIKLGANIRGWAPPLYELGEQLLASLCIEFTERHD
jgi:hypothetical protein